MKHILAVLFLSVFAQCSFAATATQSERLEFQTTGNDCYADGSPVMDGECYALVWKKTGATFSGFEMVPPAPNDLSKLNEDVWLLDYFPIAVKGELAEMPWSSCPPYTLYLGWLPADKATNGTVTVYLLDTRYTKTDGTPACGFDSDAGEDRPRRINAYTPISGLTDITVKLSMSPVVGQSLTGGSYETPTVANQMTAVLKCQIAFNAAGGICDESSREVVYGNPYGELPTATLAGYTFVGWFTAATGGAMVTAATAATSDATLFAQWTANDNTVAFDGNGGTPDEASRTVKTDAELGELPSATLRGYTLVGWFTDREKGEPVSSETIVKSNVTYYAQWTANNYEVDFEPHGGTGTMYPQPMTWDEEAALVSNLYARVGYTFLGWTDDEAELEEVLYYDGVVVSNLTDVAGGQFPLYAVWEANHYYVSFDANGGEGEMERQEFTYDQPQALAKNGFDNEGYYFVGWATNGTDEVVYRNGAEVKNLAAEEGEVVPLHAVWSLCAVKTVVPGAKVSFSTADEDVFGKKLTKYTVAGLPTGLEYDKTKGTISGTVTKKSEVGEHLVTFTKGMDVKELQIVVEKIPKISVQMWGETEAATNGCKVTGAGSYLVGKKATLTVTMPKATKSSATIFLGWYKDDKPWPNKSSYKQKTVTYTMTEKFTDIRLEARFRVETAKLVSIAWTGVGADGRTFVTGVAGDAAGMPVVVSTVDGSSLSGVKSVTVTGLPAGMKYDAKKGCIVGAPTKANAKATVKVTVTTTAGVVKATSFNVSTTPMAEAAVGSFRGFVVKGVGDGVWEDIGTFTLTVKSDGTLSAKAVTASKSVSFSGSCWDSITAEGVYCVSLKSKDKKNSLTLKLDPNVPWDGDQLTGTFNSDGLTAQRQVLGMPWYFRCVKGDETGGWELAYAESSSKADLTVKLSAGGATQIAGTLKGKKDSKGKVPTYKVSASGYVNVSLMTNGVFIADFAPVLKVGSKKKVLSIHTRLWMDRSNAHQAGDVGIGDVKFAP